MTSKSIYHDYTSLVTILSNNPTIGSQLITAYDTYRDGNPSVVNMHFRNILEFVGFNYHKKGYSPKEITYRIKNNDWNRHYCIICGDEVSQFVSVELGYTIHCGAKCAANDPDTKEARIQTCQKKYGTDNVFQIDKVKAKSHQTCLEKYGYELYQQTDEFSTRLSAAIAAKTEEEKEATVEKRIATNQKLFGVDFPLKDQKYRDKSVSTSIEKYGVEHPQQSREVRAKGEATCLEKYGNKSAIASKEVQQKIRNTNLERYGVDYPGQSEQAKEKIKQTCLAKYGVEYAIESEQSKEKSKKTCLERYGVEYSGATTMLQEKRKCTNLERYGVENYSQCAASQDKRHSKTNKKYIFPSGNEYNVQGNEPEAIDKLLYEGYKEEDLLLRNRPAIKYFWSGVDGYGDNKWHYYHPDIVIPKENRIIEVKSGWTYDGNGTRPDYLSRNLAKKIACIAAGYKFEFYIT